MLLSLIIEYSFGVLVSKSAEGWQEHELNGSCFLGFSLQVPISVRRSTRPTVSSGTGAEVWSALAPTSTRTRPNVTTRWRRLLTALKPPVRFQEKTIRNMWFFCGESQGEAENICEQLAGGASRDGFSAIKMTALGRPQFLVSFISRISGRAEFRLYADTMESFNEQYKFECSFLMCSWVNCCICAAPVLRGPGQMETVL